MNKWAHVRKAANQFRSELCEAANKSVREISPSELVHLAATRMRLTLRPVPPGHPDLPHGVDARIADESIYFRNDVALWLAIYFQAHELGHLVLGHGSRDCLHTEINPEATESNSPFGVNRVKGYGPRERIECEANIFAREFLLPSSVLKAMFIEEGKKADEIAAETLMDIELVIHQLAFCLLTPEAADSGSQDDGQIELELNDDQRTAAEIAEGPQLIDAGPGTGKTRALVGRVLHLLKNGVDPETLLVLTFSNKATDELRERIYKFAPQYASRVTIETFHSFGLDLLRKFGGRIGLKENLIVLDPVEVVFLLEEALPALGLEYFEYLPEPSKNLPDIAKAISRAKDEHVGPEAYLQLARNERQIAREESEVEKAEKALEVARVYEIYSGLLHARGAVDLGDLICRPIDLFENFPDVQAEIRTRFRHILVDEYQDVNRASGLLLKSLAGDGKGLWAVGDLRQSIHRWRGATTANIRKFNSDYPLANQTISLSKNYRSRPSIVGVFSTFASTMQTSRPGDLSIWETDHATEDVPAVILTEADDTVAEFYGIAQEIKKLNSCGFSFRDQAVVCRTHKDLTRVASALGGAGVPVLYIGDLFERPEIRDLLSLLSLAAGPSGGGLVRVGRFPEYKIPFEDVKSLLSSSNGITETFPAAIAKADDIPEFTNKGRLSLRLLEQHLRDLTYGRSAWKCLTRYIFERSDWLRPLLNDSSTSGQHRRLAVYQLLQFVHSRLKEDRQEQFPIRKLLSYIRRLEILGDEKQLREPDEWARGMDAVRLMTIHSSKGLEFRAVFLPSLSKGNIPNSYGRSNFPIPVGLSSESNPDWRKEEEECLFFVALSRAKEQLFLSRPLIKNGKKSNPSEFLARIGVAAADSSVRRWTARPEPEIASNPVLPIPYREARYRPNQIAQYNKCPLSYFYRYVLELSDVTEDTAYLEFHRAVHRTVRRISTEHASGSPLVEQLVNLVFEEEWKMSGPPADHFLEVLYKEAAKEMVRNAAARIRSCTGQLVTDYEVELNDGIVTVEFDHAEIGADLILVQRFRTGRRTKAESSNEIYGLLSLAGRQMSRGRDLRVETFYLRDNSVEPVVLTEKDLSKRLDAFSNAMKGIAVGHFPPQTDDFHCPRCAHYFICPSAI